MQNKTERYKDRERYMRERGMQWTERERWNAQKQEKAKGGKRQGCDWKLREVHMKKQRHTNGTMRGAFREKEIIKMTFGHSS